MSRRTAIAVLLATIASSIVVGFVATPHYRRLPAPCPIGRYDYFKFQEAVKRSQQATEKQLLQLADSSQDRLRLEKTAYFEAKLGYLAVVLPLAKAQIDAEGPEYRCDEPGFGLLGHDLTVPEFEDFQPDVYELVEKIAEKQEEANTLNAFIAVVAVFVPAGIALLGQRLDWRKHRETVEKV